MEEESPVFSLQSGTDSFISRSQDIFASLGALENKHSAFLKATSSSRDRDEAGLIKNDPDEDDELTNQVGSKNLGLEDKILSHGRSKLSRTRETDYEPISYSRSPNKASQFIGDDSEQDVLGKFKRPSRPPQRSSHKPYPDFKKHPEKYTCYSLRDVSEQDMSENTNQRAAFSFLHEQKLEREKLQRKLTGLPEEPKFDVSDTACSQGKITFSLPKQKMKQSDTPLKSIKIESSEKSALKHNSEPSNTKIEDARDLEAESASGVTEHEINISETGTNSFKPRKNVKRHIRAKGSDSD